jgi:hypothetical protein
VQHRIVEDRVERGFETGVARAGVGRAAASGRVRDAALSDPTGCL